MLKRSQSLLASPDLIWRPFSQPVLFVDGRCLDELDTEVVANVGASAGNLSSSDCAEIARIKEMLATPPNAGIAFGLFNADYVF